MMWEFFPQWFLDMPNWWVFGITGLILFLTYWILKPEGGDER